MIPAMTRASGEPVWRVAFDVADEASADLFSPVIDGKGVVVSAFELSPKGRWTVQAFWPQKPDRGTLDGMLALLAMVHGVEAPEIVLEQLPDLDWVRLNQESFPPVRIGRYLVYGSHVATPVPPGAIGLLIDAACAFGTGEHATTHGCLKALDRIARRRRFSRILDMGTGTGILGIAAAKTWHVPVRACDIDRHSVRVADENVGVNGVADRVRCFPSDGYSAPEVRAGRSYDLVFANILAKPLVRMAPDLASALVPGGMAILSGLLAGQEKFVLAAHRAHGLSFRFRIARQGWHTLVLEKPH